MSKILSLLKYALLAISLVMVILVFVNGEDAVGSILNWAYIMLGIAILVTVLLPLINLAQNPKGAIRSLIGLAVLVVILIVTYSLSSTEPVVNAAGGYFDNSTDLKITDMGLYTTYIAIAVAVLTVIFGEIRNSFK